MSGTVTHRHPTNGTPSEAPASLRLRHCQPFAAAAQDRATEAQDPDIGRVQRAATLRGMPRSLLRAARCWLDAGVRLVARVFRASAVPSSSSPATGRPVPRALFAGKALGFREFTTPRAFAHGERSRLRVKTTGVSARVMPLRQRSPQ